MIAQARDDVQTFLDAVRSIVRAKGAAGLYEVLHHLGCCNPVSTTWTGPLSRACLNGHQQLCVLLRLQRT